jgi:hypothetical protein
LVHSSSTGVGYPTVARLGMLDAVTEHRDGMIEQRHQDSVAGLRAEFDEYLAAVDDPLVRSGLELIPTLGGFLNECLTHATARRAARQLSWLGDLQRSTGLSTQEFAEALSADPVLTACFDVALAAAAEAVTQNQIRALGQVVRRAIAREDAVDVVYFQVATLRELTPAHLDVLRIIDRRHVIDPPSADVRDAGPGHPKYDAFTKEVGEANSTSYADILQEWPGVERVLDAVLAGLHRTGLIEETSVKGHGYEDQRWLRTGYAWHLLKDLDGGVGEANPPSS